MLGCRLLALRLPLLTTSARVFAGKPVGAAVRLRQPISPLLRTAASQASATTTAPEMAEANGGSVTAEEVEQLRQQLETLQVRSPRSHAHPHAQPPLPAPPPAARCR